jgi:thiamine transport system permease protein
VDSGLDPNGIALSRSDRTFSLKVVAPWLSVSLFLGIFFFLPLVHILWTGLNPSGIRTITVGSLGHAGYIFLFTFYQAFLSTLLTLLLGLPAAFLFARFDFPGKAFLRTITAVPFMLPTVVVAAAFIALFGPRGWMNVALVRLFGLSSPPFVLTGSLGAILLAHVFYNTTIVIRIVGNSVSHADPRMSQAARTLGANPWQVFWRVTLILLRPSILAAALLVFIFDFTSFGVILLLGGPGISTLEVEIYKQVTYFFNLPLAAVLSLIQLLCTLVFSIIYTRVINRTAVSVQPHSNAVARPHSFLSRSFVGGLSTILMVFYLLPLASLPLRSILRLEADAGQRGQVRYGLTGDYYSELFINRNDSLFYVPPFKAIGNSLAYAGVTVVLSLLLGFPAAAALARPGRLEKLIDPFLMLPLGASAVTLGLGLIITFNKPFPGTGFLLLASPIIVPIAHTIIALPFVIRTLQPPMAAIPDRLRQAAASLGASPRRVWMSIDWPIVSRATLSAAVFAFTISLGEFGASSLVVRPEYPTLPIAIARFLSQPGGLNYGQAMAMATILMFVCGIGILLIERLRLPGAVEF